MGQRYLLDTNIVIYYLEGLLNSSDKVHVKNIIENGASLSVISKIELLAWNPPYGSNTLSLISFIKSSHIYPLDEQVVNQTIQIRKSFKKVKLPDAVIAATCVHHNLHLLSRNTSDFINIKELTLINPFDF